MIEAKGAGVRQEWSPEELLANWTLVDGDWDLVANKSGATRLGFSLLLKFFELEGRFPDVLEEVPPAAVEYLADLVKVPATDFAKYTLVGRTAEYHRKQIREALGFRPSTVADEKALAEWLAVEVCSVELVEDRQREALLVECRARKVEPPGRTRVEKVLVAARGKWEKTFCARTIGRLGEAGTARLLSLVDEDNEEGTALLVALKRDPGAVGLDSLLTEITKLKRRAQARPARRAVRRLLGEAGGRLAGTGNQDVPLGLPPADDVVHELLTDYAAYLHGERGLAGESVRCYCSQARKFLTALPTPLEESLSRLNAARVTAFMVRITAESESVWPAKALVTAVRSLLRYLHVDGRIPAPLIGAVPAVAGWRLDSLPRGLAPQQVTALLAAPDPGTATGRRDRAVLTVLARLGLRGAEVAALQMADIDWHAGEVAVRGKGSRVERLPLTAEAGEVLADYITGGRPGCLVTAVFVTSRAPYQALDGSCIRAIMGRACEQAGLPRLGAHRLRHALATTILRAGAPLPEVGQVLRHRSPLSTTVYAKVDQAALRTLAQPWPEGGAR